MKLPRNKNQILTALAIIFTASLLIWLFFASQGPAEFKQLSEISFDNGKTPPDLCVLNGCLTLPASDSAKLTNISQDIKGFQTISILLRPGQIDEAGILDFGNGTSIVVKNGQIEVNKKLSFWGGALRRLQNQDPGQARMTDVHIFINGKPSSTLFPYYWQQVIISFPNSFDIHKLTFGQAEKSKPYEGFFDNTRFYSGVITEQEAQKQLQDLLDEIRNKNNEQR